MNFYAEFETDKLIREKYFPDYDYKGVIVEVGGGTPEFLSMSKHFKDNGWRAIIIEPNPTFVKQHLEAGNEVYQYACSNEDRKGDFTIVKQQVDLYGGIITDHSFSSLSIKESFLSKTGFSLDNLNKEKLEVEIRKLDTILNELNVCSVDILSIDVEGWEIEVMKGLNTQTIDCKLIVVENFTEDDSYRSYFESIGYYLDGSIQHNQIYLKK